MRGHNPEENQASQEPGKKGYLTSRIPKNLRPQL